MNSKDTESEKIVEKKTLRQILQEHDSDSVSENIPNKEDTHQVLHIAITQSMNDRFSELARIIFGTSSTTNLVAGGSMTSH